MKKLRNLHPKWIALTISIGIIAWLASGMLDSKSGNTAGTEAATEKPTVQRRKISVRVVDSQSELLTKEAISSARTAASRRVQLRAEIKGKVEKLGAKRGERVNAGDMIATIAINDLQARVEKNQALLQQRKLQYSAAKKLNREGHQTAVELAQAQANLAVAEAELKSSRQDLANTVIRAPFSGILEQRPVEVGNYVGVGDEIGWLIQQDPFLVRGNVSEDIISHLRLGQAGRARMQDGKEIEGFLRFVASEADERTRTFAVELEIPNPDQDLIAGTSALLILPMEQVEAHEVEPATLTLSKDGQFGIKAVNSDNMVVFHEAQIAQNRGGLIWLTGLPKSLKIITVGQGFVSAGDEVEIVEVAETTVSALSQ